MRRIVEKTMISAADSIHIVMIFLNGFSKSCPREEETWYRNCPIRKTTRAVMIQLTESVVEANALKMGKEYFGGLSAGMKLYKIYKIPQTV